MVSSSDLEDTSPVLQVLDVVLVKGDQMIDCYLPFGDAKYLYDTILRLSVSGVEIRIVGRHLQKI